MKTRSELARFLEQHGAVIVRNGSKHQIWQLNGQMVVVPYGTLPDRGPWRAKLAARHRR